MSDTDTHEGGCVCGAVRYRVHGKPVFASVCHCAFCRRRTGSAFAVVVYFDENAVQFVQGELAEYEHRSDVSGRWLRMNFCPRCGTTVSHTAEARPGLRAIAGGTFDDPDWFAIDRHIWIQSKQPWVCIPSNATTFPQGAVASTATGTASAAKP